MRKLQTLQKSFDRRWGFDFPMWEEVVGDQRTLNGVVRDARDQDVDALVRRLEYVALALAGEVGEFANAIKKVRRRLLTGASLEDIDWSGAKDEAADILAYLLKLANLMAWDLEELYRSKMAQNATRFERREQKKTL